MTSTEYKFRAWDPQLHAAGTPARESLEHEANRY